MSIKTKFLVITSLIFCTIFTYSFNIEITSAEIATSVTDMNIVISPSKPRPFSTVTAKVEYFGTNLNNSEIVWSINGKVEKTGIALKEIQFTVGKSGSITTISATIKTPTGEMVTNSKTINPASVSLIWEANTYSPPFYKGRSWYTKGSSIRVIAIPDMVNSTGNVFKSADLTYKWYRNNQVLGEQSGRGKNIAIIETSSYIDDETSIMVEVFSPDNSVSASYITTITPKDPQVLIYEMSPIYGVLYEKALYGQMQVYAKEIILKAEPMFYSTNNGIDSVDYTWRVNGNNIIPSTSENVIILRPGTDNPSLSIYMTAQHINRILQGSKYSLDLIYNQNNNSSDLKSDSIFE